MPVPPNVDTCTVTGTFVNTDGRVPTGTIEFVPAPVHIADPDAPATIIGVPVTVHLDADGAFTVDLVATDDPDLNPVDWTYTVRVRIANTAAYTFSMDAPAGATVDLADVTPIDSSTGTAVVVGPPGPPGAGDGVGIPAGGTSGQLLAKDTATDYDVEWVDPPEGGGGGGTGLPDGGTTGQVLTKQSATDGDADWEDSTGGVTSVTVDVIWTGDQAAYDAIVTPDPATLYFITAA